MDDTQIYENLEKDFVRIPKQTVYGSEYKNNYNYENTIILKNYVNNLEKKHNKTL